MSGRRGAPKIAEHLIPPLYRLARSRGQPMTRLVAEMLEAYLASHVVAPAPANAPKPGRPDAAKPAA